MIVPNLIVHGARAGRGDVDTLAGQRREAAQAEAAPAKPDGDEQHGGAGSDEVGEVLTGHRGCSACSIGAVRIFPSLLPHASVRGASGALPLAGALLAQRRRPRRHPMGRGLRLRGPGQEV